MANTTSPIARKGQILSNYLKQNQKIRKTNDDATLIDIHIGNPLRRITTILEEIKQQKAFSFTLKGSLGVMGVLLTVSAFGIFGGSKMLCDKGRQSQLGTLHILQTTVDKTESNLLVQAWNFLTNTPLAQKEASDTPRVILVKDDNSVIHLQGFAIEPDFQDQRVVATGKFDTCIQTLTINHETDLEKVNY